jgi:proton-translocating NADH-quinone oxidoreductase chain N
MSLSPVHFIAVPLLAAFLIPIIGRFSKEFVKIVPGIVFLYLSYVAISLFPVALNKPVVEVIAGWKPPFGISLYYGPLAAFLTSLITLMGFVIWVYSYKFIIREPIEKYYMLFMLLITGSTGIILTGDLFNMFVFLEITAIAAYSLTAFLRDRDGAEAAFKYLLIGSFASAFFLLAVMLIYSQVGTLNFADIADKMNTVSYGTKILILIFFLVGLGIEAEVFPLNGWAPDAYSQAPSPIGAVFGGIVVKASIYALMRIIFLFFNFNEVFHFLLIIGIITMLIAEMSAMKQHQIKRMLAFSSIGQMGLVIIAFSVGTTDSVQAGLFQMFNHAVIKAMLFFAAGYLVFHSGSKNISALDGLGRDKPVTSFFFAIGALAIMGLPPFSGFWSKLYILLSVADAGLIAAVVLVLTASVIEAVYYLRVVSRLYFNKETASHSEVRRTPVSGLVAMGVLAVVIIVVGLYPDYLWHMLKPAAEELINKAAYIGNGLLK